MGRDELQHHGAGGTSRKFAVVSKPEDRFGWCSEESGWHPRSSKAQKRRTGKLGYTEQNLLRVVDLIKEVKRHNISLERQAGEGKAHKTVANELQQLDTQLERGMSSTCCKLNITERTHTAEQLVRRHQRDGAGGSAAARKMADRADCASVDVGTRP